jgi:hypothetical protein
MGAGTLLYGMNGDYDASFDDTLKIRIAYEHDSDVTSPTQIPSVITAAEIATGTPVPRRRARLGTTNLYASQFHYEQDRESKRRFYFDVTYARPSSRALDGSFDLHPLNYPPVVTITYMDREKIVDKAYNRDAITGGGARAANTLGYIQNGAGVVSQTPILDTDRIPVIVISRNVASLATVLSLNETYIGTTNNATTTVFGNDFAARTLKYQGTDAADRQEFDGVFYYPIETRIEIHATTDVEVDSVGTQEVNGSGEMLPIYQSDGTTPISEPIPINLDGTAGTPGTSVQITYYYLSEVSYTPLLG